MALLDERVTKSCAVLAKSRRGPDAGELLRQTAQPGDIPRFSRFSLDLNPRRATTAHAINRS